VFGLKPLSDAVALIVPVAALPPESVVPKEVVVPYSNFGVVEVEDALIVPLSVAVDAPIEVGLLVFTEIPPTAVATFDAVHPPAGSTAASSFAF